MRVATMLRRTLNSAFLFALTLPLGLSAQEDSLSSQDLQGVPDPGSDLLPALVEYDDRFGQSGTGGGECKTVEASSALSGDASVAAACETAEQPAGSGIREGPDSGDTAWDKTLSPDPRTAARQRQG